jgi:hypothetical protein
VEKKRRLVTTRPLRAWLQTLTPEKASKVTAAMDRVNQAGPTRGRPLVDHVKGSRHHKMKELRTGTIRVFFVFERDESLMLCGGDKRGARNDWYPRKVGEADRLYDQYRRDNGREGPGWRRDPPSHGR